MTNHASLLLLAVALQIGAVGWTFAASPGAGSTAIAAASDDAQPQSTTATYGDWTLRCVVPQPPASGATAQPATAPAEQCEIDQAVQIKGQAEPVAQVAMGPDPVSGVSRLVAQVPVGAWLPAGVTLRVGAADPLALIFKRCLPSACLADTDIPSTLDAAMRSGNTGGLTFQMVAGKDVTVPMSFRGFKAAADALAKAAH